MRVIVLATVAHMLRSRREAADQDVVDAVGAQASDDAERIELLTHDSPLVRFIGAQGSVP